MTVPIRVGVIAAAVGALAGCGSEDSAGPSTPGVTNVGIIAPASVAVGGTLPMIGSASPRGPVSWTSLTPSVATVSVDGKVTGVTPGTAELKATSGTASATAQVIVLPAFVDLALGRGHACGRSAENVLYCWGDNAVAALGKPSPESCPAQRRECSTTPRSLVDSRDLVQISGGGSGTTCGLTADGKAYCWGNDEFDWIGPAADRCTVFGVGTSACSRTPIAVPGGRAFTRIALGGAFACALSGGGAAYCWGEGDQGQLGATPSELCAGVPCSRTPVAVAGGLSFTSIAAGNQHACGVTAGGTAYCWGANAEGQLGAQGPGSPSPIPVSGGHSFTMLAASFTHTCGVDKTGAAYCWGDNTFGQLGDGTTTASATPRPVSGGLTFATVATALEHSCGLTTSGAAYCWGQNTGLQVKGQLGDGTSTSRSVPVRVTTNRVFVQLLTGRQFSCGRTGDGLSYCWGDNRFGQLGVGEPSLAYSLTPVGVAGAPK